jgi:predicted DNA-binding protein (MmcQ/YjbR family)
VKKISPEKLGAKLRERALSYPGAQEEFPWDHIAVKVKGKTFVFLSFDKTRFSMSVKLPRSRDMAHDLPFAEPTGYGLGQHGWITAAFDKGSDPPVDLLLSWIDESYRAIAPKKLIAEL